MKRLQKFNLLVFTLVLSHGMCTQGTIAGKKDLILGMMECYNIGYLDYNNDTIKDLIIPAKRKLFYCEGEANQKFKDKEEPFSLDANILSMEIADLDNDGEKDIVLGTNQSVFFLKGQTIGFSSPIKLNANINSRIEDVLFADVDNDTLLDIIVAEYSNDKLVYYKNLDSGNFASRVILKSQLDEMYSIDNFDF